MTSFSSFSLLLFHPRPLSPTSLNSTLDSPCTRAVQPSYKSSHVWIVVPNVQVRNLRLRNKPLTKDHTIKGREKGSHLNFLTPKFRALSLTPQLPHHVLITTRIVISPEIKKTDAERRPALPIPEFNSRFIFPANANSRFRISNNEGLTAPNC